MRISVIVGVLLIVLGVVALGFQSFTYFTVERVVNAGPLHIDVQRPHTIAFHPVVGAVALILGVALVFIGAKGKSS
jgi:uncharacterized membrane protein HdeD (DUF308 family)